MDLPGRANAKSWEGQEVRDLTGVPVGGCVGVFADADTEVVEWLLVDVTGHRRSFVPALDVVEESGGVRLSFPRDRVLSAPSVGDAEQLSKSDEITLYRHYDVPFTDDASGSLLPDAVDIAEQDVPPADDGREPTEVRPVVPPPFGLEPFGTPVLGEAFTPFPPVAPPPPVQSETPPPPPAPEPTVDVQVEEVVVSAPPSPTSPDREVRAEQQDSSQAGTLSTAAPLAAVAATVAAVWLVLRALAQRAERRRSLPARTRRTGRQAGRAGRGAATQVGSALAAASAAADQQRKAAGKQRDKAAKTAAKKRKTAAKGKAQRTQAAKTARQQREQVVQTAARAQQGVAAATSSVASSASHAAHAVAEVPGSVAGAVADGTRRAGRSVASVLWDVLTAAAAAAGYVLGARAGRERYEEITDLAAATAARPEVQTAKQALLDPEHRDEAIESLKEQGQQLLTRVLPG